MIADRLRMIQAVSGGGGGGGGFDPSQLSGLKLWLKADAGVTVDGSGNVSSWADQSGNGLDATQTDAARRPAYLSSDFNGLPAIYFGPTSKSLNGVNLGDGIQTYPDREIIIFASQDSSRTTENYIYSEGTVFVGDMQVGRIGTNALLRGMSANQYYKQKIITDTTYPIAVSVNPSGFSLRDGFGYYDTQATTGYYTGASLRQYRIGIANGYSGSSFMGKVHEIINFDRNLTDVERSQVYDYLDSKYRYRTSLLLNMQGTAGGTTFIDESPNAFTVTRVGDTVLVSDATFGTVGAFDGAGDELNAGSNPAFAFGTGDFTIECFVQFSALPDTGQIMGIANMQTSPSSANTGMWWFALENSGGTTRLRLGRHGNTSVYAFFNWTPSLNQWYHVAVVRSNSTIFMFIDGISQSVTSSTGWNNDFYASGTLMIGSMATVLKLNGKLGPTRLTNGIARYTANFTPPTGKFPTS